MYFHFLRLLIPLLAPESALFIICFCTEPKQCIGIDLVSVPLGMCNVHMGLHLVLSGKCHVTLRLAYLIWTQVVGLLEMPFERFIILIIDMLVSISTKVACQMVSTQVLIEILVVVEELLAEITPRMWQYLGTFLGRRVTVLYMISQCFDVVNSLFSDEYHPSLEANFAKCFLMGLLKMAP